LRVIREALIEPAVITEKPDVRFQFEREGYFYAGPVDYTAEHPVFNKIVSLKDSWAKKTKGSKKESKPQAKKEQKRQIDGEVAPMSEEGQVLYDHYTNEHKLNPEVANTLARDKRLSQFFQEALSVCDAPVCMANMVANEVARELKQQEIDELKFAAKEIAELVQMIEDETISNQIAKEVFEQMCESGENPAQIVEARGLKQISDPDVILPIIEEVIAKNPDNVAKFKAGNGKLLGFFVGQVLKATGGKANPKVVNALVVKSLQ
jgi:glutaminyl-tRNA synthetase